MRVMLLILISDRVVCITLVLYHRVGFLQIFLSGILEKGVWMWYSADYSTFSCLCNRKVEAKLLKKLASAKTSTPKGDPLDPTAVGSGNPSTGSRLTFL